METSKAEPPALRGAARPSRAAPARLVAWIGLIATFFVAVAIVVTTTTNNQRVTRLQAHGITTTITVTSCIGNLGGSGSNAAGFTCHGSYSVNGQVFTSVINGQRDFLAPGRTIAGVADPSNFDYVVTMDAVPTLHVGSPLFALFATGGVALCFLLPLIRKRLPRPHA